jgi:hypothetical protein
MFHKEETRDLTRSIFWMGENEKDTQNICRKNALYISSWTVRMCYENNIKIHYR